MTLKPCDKVGTFLLFLFVLSSDQIVPTISAFGFGQQSNNRLLFSGTNKYGRSISRDVKCEESLNSADGFLEPSSSPEEGQALAQNFFDEVRKRKLQKREVDEDIDVDDDDDDEEISFSEAKRTKEDLALDEENASLDDIVDADLAAFFSTEPASTQPNKKFTGGGTSSSMVAETSNRGESTSFFSASSQFDQRTTAAPLSSGQQRIREQEFNLAKRFQQTFPFQAGLIFFFGLLMAYVGLTGGITSGADRDFDDEIYTMGEQMEVIQPPQQMPRIEEPSIYI